MAVLPLRKRAHSREKYKKGADGNKKVPNPVPQGSLWPKAKVYTELEYELNGCENR